MILEVVLDHLENQYGSVTLDDCESVSRNLGERLEKLDPELDYQLKIQSAGAERKLRLPDDLDRFQGLLMNLEILNEEGKTLCGVFKIIQRTGERIRLEPFRGKGKKSGKNSILETQVDRVKKGNLYIHI